ncbi:hypothetical protein ISS37_03910 [candidate division KSB1 bacterium]|nr:hypothetical protein [candidate division KSB1 bacterium]
MMERGNMIHVWVERLTSFGIIKLYCDLRKYDDIIIFYHRLSRVAGLFAVLLENGSVSSRRIVFRKIDYEYFAKDAHGRALIYKVEQGAAILAERFFGEYLAQMEWLPDGYDEYKDEWKRIVKSSLTMVARESLKYLFIIANMYDTHQIDRSGIKQIIIYLNQSVVSRFMERFFQIPINIPSSIRTIPNYKYNLMFYPIPGKLIQLFFQIFIGCMKNGKNLHYISEQAVKNGVFIEEYHRSIFSRYPLAGHLFWFSESNLPPERVILYFDRPDSPCDTKARQEVESYGFGWLDMDNPWRHVRSPVRILSSCFFNVRKSFLKSRMEISIWLWVFLFYHSLLLECFREIYRTYNVKMMHQHQEWWPSSLVRALAIRMEGGKSVWFFWSVTQYPFGYFNSGFADLVLSWGPLNDGFINAHDFSYRYLVRIGRIAADGFDDEVRRDARAIRKRFSPDTSFVITIFDSSHSNDPGFHQSTASMLTFYDNLLSSAQQRSHWGILIKSKGDFFNRLPLSHRFYSAFEQLTAQGRCILLDGQNLVSRAAFAGDVAVCYNINSAGVLAALCNKPVLHWDICGALDHPLYQAGGEGGIIFKTYDEVLNALLRIEEGDSVCGNHDQWLGLVDEFRDEMGNQRAAELIDGYMMRRDQGMDQNTALRKSVEAFSRRWGQDKVSTMDCVQPHLGNDLWLKVIEKASQSVEQRLSHR